ncbi:MAG: hypothetical protein JWP82_1029 [Humibacillus sp.]|nr:hypothetical protein [Humibacillus sp.]
MNDRDLEAEFQRIVAGWDDVAPEPDRAATPRAGMPSADDPLPPVDDRAAGTTTPQRPVDDEVRGDDASPTDLAHGGALGLPIASTTSHVWRSGAPAERVEDVDALLDASAAARGETPADHFVPPSEIDLPSAESDPMFWAIVGGLVGGPLLLLYLLFFDRDGSGWWVVIALTMVVVGFVLLVLRGGNERDPFDDGTRV